MLLPGHDYDDRFAATLGVECASQPPLGGVLRGTFDERDLRPTAYRPGNDIGARRSTRLGIPHTVRVVKCLNAHGRRGRFIEPPPAAGPVLFCGLAHSAMVSPF